MPGERWPGRPVLPLIAILTLALGIGLASTIFSAVNALLIKPLPFMRDQQQTRRHRTSSQEE